jgi:hypothetical protein
MDQAGAEVNVVYGLGYELGGVFRGLGGSDGQVPDLVRDDGEPRSGLPGPRGLDGRVQAKRLV